MKEFNYLYEKRRMLNSLGRTGSMCDGVNCLECTSWTSSDDMVSSWKYAKLAEE